jgi:hypothetical protein
MASAPVLSLLPAPTSRPRYVGAVRQNHGFSPSVAIAEQVNVSAGLIDQRSVFLTFGTSWPVPEPIVLELHTIRTVRPSFEYSFLPTEPPPFHARHRAFFLFVRFKANRPAQIPMFEKAKAVSSRPCPRCGGLMYYVASLQTLLNGLHRRTCRRCGYTDPIKAKFIPGY